MHIQRFNFKISRNKSNLSLELIKYPFFKNIKKWFLIHKKFYGLNAICVKRTVFGNYGLKIWVKHRVPSKERHLHQKSRKKVGNIYGHLAGIAI